MVRTIALHFQDGISIGTKFVAGSRVSLSATDAGTIDIGDRVAMGAGVRLVAQGGRIRIGNDVFLGDGCILVSCGSIDIGADTQVAEYVVIRDHDHKIGPEPIRTSGFETAPVAIGRDCWLGAKVTVLRGSRIGDGAVLGAHSLVRSDIPPNAIAVGCPAKVVRQRHRSRAEVLEVDDVC